LLFQRALQGTVANPRLRWTDPVRPFNIHPGDFFVRRFQLSCACLISLAAIGSTAQAANLGLSGELGTTGVGVHLSVPLAQQLNARFGVNYFDYSFNSSTNDVNYDAKARLRTFDALLDWFPFDSGFRLSGGVVYNGNKIDATGKPGPTASTPSMATSIPLRKPARSTAASISRSSPLTWAWAGAMRSLPPRPAGASRQTWA
jgi:hypothetical protein